MTTRDFIEKYGAIISIVLGSIATYYFHYQEIKEFQRCNIKTEGVIRGFSFSNNYLMVRIEFFKDNLLYNVAAKPTMYLKNRHNSGKEEKCIGLKCIVYYACDNPRNIDYELIEQGKDTLLIK
jgi:hypothetical protein